MANDEKDLTDVGIRAGHPSHPVQSEEGIAHPQGRFVGDLQVKHEHSDVGLRPIFITAGIVFALLVVCYAVMWGLFQFWGWRQESAKQARTPMEALPVAERPGPLLVEGQEAEDLKRIKLLQGRRVEEYGWVDRQNNVVHIPVERAMDKIAADGLPTGPQWQLGPGEAIIQGVIRPASELTQPLPPSGGGAPAAGSAVPGRVNTGAGQPATSPASAASPGGANPGEQTMRMNQGFGGPSGGARRQ